MTYPEPNLTALAMERTARTVQLVRDDLPLCDVPPPPGGRPDFTYPAALLLSQASALQDSELPLFGQSTDRWSTVWVRCWSCSAQLGFVAHPTVESWPRGPVLHASVPPSVETRNLRRGMFARSAERKGLEWKGHNVQQNHPYLVILGGSSTPRFLPLHCREHGYLLVKRDAAASASDVIRSMRG